MFRISVMYPNTAGKRFDMDYYLNNHMPMVGEKMGSRLKGSQVDHGLAGGAPDAPATYLVMAHLLVDSVEDFQAAMAEHGNEIMGDIPNYTDIEPVIQISEVKI